MVRGGIRTRGVGHVQQALDHEDVVPAIVPAIRASGGWGGGVGGRWDESLGGCWAGASDGKALRSLAAGRVGGQGHDPQSDDDVEQDGVDGHDLVSSDLKGGRPLRG
jgi:hypothetical protein